MPPTPLNSPDLSDKVVLITGGTEGIGKAAALQFAQRGAAVTLIGRNRQKTARTLDELKAATGNDRLSAIRCDLARLGDVRRAAAEFKARNNQLDILVNNAGATFKTLTHSPDGYERTFALNHLSHFLLTTELLDLICATPGARVVSTSSSMQARGRLDLQRVATDLSVSGPVAYGTSKLANILFTQELQRRVGPSVAVNCFHPGIVRTRFGAFGADFGPLINLIYLLAQPFAKTPEEGADTLVWLATAPEAARLRGEYLTNRTIIQPQTQALDPVLAAGLWTLSEKLCADALSAELVK